MPLEQPVGISNEVLATQIDNLTKNFDKFTLKNDADHGIIIGQTTKTNGRTTALEDMIIKLNLKYEKTRSMLYGAWITITIILLPIAFLVVQIYFSKR